MSRVFVSASTGAAVYVFSDDHCPPHVHARHQADGWIARVGFSYLGAVVTLMSISPVRHAPRRRTMNGLFADIRSELAACRRAWWAIRRTTCLANQWVVMQSTGSLALSSATDVQAQQVADSSYTPDERRLRVVLTSGATIEVATPP